MLEMLAFLRNIIHLFLLFYDRLDISKNHSRRDCCIIFENSISFDNTRIGDRIYISRLSATFRTTSSIDSFVDT